MLVAKERSQEAALEIAAQFLTNHTSMQTRTTVSPVLVATSQELLVTEQTGAGQTRNAHAQGYEFYVFNAEIRA